MAGMTFEILFPPFSRVGGSSQSYYFYFFVFTFLSKTTHPPTLGVQLRFLGGSKRDLNEKNGISIHVEKKKLQNAQE